jgi:hypothetical protein
LLSDLIAELVLRQGLVELEIDQHVVGLLEEGWCIELSYRNVDDLDVERNVHRLTAGSLEMDVELHVLSY